ncbi:MAG: hypothetical protein Q8O41_02075, partial [Candidatus Methanoperedens sp.]|nr:hypothetical protein [Candidatus Methanoperedens sp.]
RSKFEKGDFTGAIQTYEESLKYFQDSELITKTKANIENCYIEIDARKVEELSAQAVSLLKEAAALNETFKAIEKLNQANNRLNDAVALATQICRCIITTKHDIKEYSRPEEYCP